MPFADMNLSSSSSKFIVISQNKKFIYFGGNVKNAEYVQIK